MIDPVSILIAGSILWAGEEELKKSKRYLEVGFKNNPDDFVEPEPEPQDETKYQ